MRDIADLTVTELRFFSIDVIPFNSLLTASNLKTVTAPHSFKNIEIAEDDNRNYTALYLRTGEFKCENRIYPIELIVIERSKIILKIKADSDIAGLLYNEVHKALSIIDQSGLYKKNKPLTMTDETSCVVTLDIEYMDIFSNSFRSFLDKEAVSALHSSSGKNIDVQQLLPKSLAFNVVYEVKDGALAELNLGVYPKSLVIEPRIGATFKEKRFFIASPTDSKTHLKMISEFEKKFKKK